MATPLEQFEALRAQDPVAAAAVLQAATQTVWSPHAGGQLDVLRSEARFRVLRAGRRWGKTELAAHEIIMAALEKPNQMVWWVANSDKNVRRGYRKVLSQLPKGLLSQPAPSEGSNDRILRFKNGSQMEFYTGGSPDSLAGEGVDFVVVDEAALIPENVWYQLLRPTLADKNGRALIISTPRGRNWFWKMWNQGQKPGPYESFHFTSYDNPTIPDSEVDEARETLPYILFEQEFMGAFIQNAASIFNLMPTERAPAPVVEGLETPYGHIVLGVDVAKKEDFTVIAGARAEDRRPVYFQRFNEISWPVQEDLIRAAVEDLHTYPDVEGVSVVVDSTGLGEVVFDHLDEHGLDVIPVNFTTNKERMARLLAADIEQGRAFVYDDPEGIVVPEFESYEYEITANGRYKFEAASGHDDTVSATMLQNWGIVHEAPPDARVLELERQQHDDVDKTDPLGSVAETLEPDATASIMANPAAWASGR